MRTFRTFGVAAAVALGGFAAGYVYAAQPHMDAAIGYLQNARHELQIAEGNKAGHREAAIRLVDQAMGEVRAGIAAAR